MTDKERAALADKIRRQEIQREFEGMEPAEVKRAYREAKAIYRQRLDGIAEAAAAAGRCIDEGDMKLLAYQLDIIDRANREIRSAHERTAELILWQGNAEIEECLRRR